MKGVAYRLMLCLSVVPLGLLWAPFVLTALLAAGFAWLFLGPDEGRTDRILASNFAGFPVIYLDWLLEKAKS